jgi:hypothetical protein
LTGFLGGFRAGVALGVGLAFFAGRRVAVAASLLIGISGRLALPGLLKSLFQRVLNIFTGIRKATACLS